MRKSSIATLVLAAACTLPLWAQQTARPARASTMSASDREALAAALRAQDQGTPQQAEPVLRALARKYPTNFDVVESLGVLYAEGGEFASALPLFERACKLHGSSAVAYANLGAVYLKLHRNSDAVRALDHAARLEPANEQTQSDLGQALMLEKRPKDAAAAFARAAALKPADADMLYNWALALFDSGDAARAGSVLAKMPDAQSSAQAESLFGDICERQKQFKQAAQHYQRAADLDPSEANLYVLGVEFLRHWTFAPAIKVLQYGVKKYPDSTRLLTALGIARYSANDYPASIVIFSRLLDRHPDDAFYADMLGHMCALQPSGNQGCASLEPFAEKHPQNATAAAYAAASILHRPSDAQNLELARHLLDRALKIDPNLAEANYQLAVLDQQQGKWAESIAPLNRAIAAKPDYARAHYRLGLAWSHTGQHAKAQREIALEQKYSKQQTADLNARLRQITTFLISQK